jgi:hypothetical protein
MSENIEATLSGREARYGAFTNHAKISQRLKDIMWAEPKWATLSDDQKEALEMVQHKVARILNGDVNYSDNWHDGAGYFTLVDQRLKKEGT